MTGEEFKVTRQAPNPNELMSLEAYYQLYPEMDDRPEDIKREASLELQEQEQEQEQEEEKVGN